MSTITRERAELKAFITGFLSDPMHDDKSANSLTAEVFRIALASLEAEPAIHRWRRVTVEPYGPYPWHYGDFIGFSKPVEGIEDEYFYSAPPAPVCVMDEAQSRELFEKNCMANIERNKWHPDLYAHLPAREQWAAWEACRAAMLQGAEPVTTAYKLPANTPCKDAPEHIWLQTAGIWPENGEFSELTWCSENQHPDDTLYVRADVVPGNSPVVPDGWVMVPVEPTEDMIVNGFESEPDESFSDAEVWEAYDAMSGCQQAAHRAKLCWSAMISAAPKPDVR